MYVFVVANFLVIPLLVLRAPDVGDAAQHVFTPGIKGGASSTAVLLIIAIVGTTVAPWQLFFQQSNIIDKRITPRWINYERADTVIGAFVVVIGAGALICVTAFAFGGTADFGHFLNAGTVATQLGQQLGLGRGHDLCDRAAERLADRRGGGDAGDLVCVRRRVRRQPLAQPRAARREAVLRELHADGDGCRRHRADPGRTARPDHDLGAGAGRRAAAERHRVPAVALQRPRGARAVGERALAERGRGADRGRARGAVADPDGDARCSRPST